MEQPKRIFLIGSMAAGKTTLGRILATSLNARFLDSDQILQSKFNLSISDIFAQHGEDFFRAQEEQVLNEVSKQANIVLATGGGSILSARTRDILVQRGLVCYLQVSVAEQLSRLQHDCLRPLLPVHSARANFLHYLHAQRAYLYEQIADIIVNTDNLSIEDVARKVRDLAG